jgi:2',5'-phosphodiesterase
MYCCELQPDICCLQEVDDKVFTEYLAPHLSLSGFGGHYTKKQGKVREGSALFWREDKWGLAAVQDVMLRVSACVFVQIGDSTAI